MAIPDYQTIMLPLLRLASDNKEHSIREAIDLLSNEFNLSKDERRKMLPSGKQAVFDNRVHWACTYLKKAGLLDSTKRGHFQITKRGQDILKENPIRIDNSLLYQFPEFVEFKIKTGQSYIANNNSELIVEEETPEERLESAYQKIRETLVQELLKQIMDCSPVFFERLVVDLLLKMGYGGSRKDAGAAIGRSNDGGIDGIIKEDRLGLDIIYIQAKRWENQIGRPEIQKFVGALAGQKAKKGVFITTSHFTNEAIKYITSIDSKVVLIDGLQLAQLMIDYNIGVSVVSNYEIKRIDSNYFIDE